MIATSQQSMNDHSSESSEYLRGKEDEYKRIRKILDKFTNKLAYERGLPHYTRKEKNTITRVIGWISSLEIEEEDGRLC